MIFKVGEKKYYFFRTLAGSVFIGFIGIFSTLWMIFFTLTLVFFSPAYNQTALFLFWGAVFFSISYFLYLKRYRRTLQNMNYQAFLKARNGLIYWILWTLNLYLLSCWLLLILIGSFNGFGFVFPVTGGQHVLITGSANSTKLTGMILWFVHLFAIFLFKTITLYWKKIILFAHTEFSKRRKVLADVRQEAKTQI